MSVQMSEILHLAIAQFERDHAMQMADAYKWLFQATQGSEHAISDESGVRTWLDREWEMLAPTANDEMLVEPLRPDGALVRFHLRPYQERNGDKEALFLAFVASASAFLTNRADFIVIWQLLGETLRHQPRAVLPSTHWTYAEWERLDELTRPQGYPALHHSPEYRRLRQPAYRVLTGVQAMALQQ